jgi:hypothetical protein
MEIPCHSGRRVKAESNRLLKSGEGAFIFPIPGRACSESDNKEVEGRKAAHEQKVSGRLPLQGYRDLPSFFFLLALFF